MNLLSTVQENTIKYLSTVSKAERKAIGQFFTPSGIANYMASLSKHSYNYVKILDPGAGSGILSAALLDNLIINGVKYIRLDLYENHALILPLLKSNLEYIKQTLEIRNIYLDYKIIEKNFIEDNKNVWFGMQDNGVKYDIVISNPPYKKIGKNDLEATIMKEIVYGQPNLYFLFMAMGAKLLKENGELIYIVPRSFSSGLYFKQFRKWFFNFMQLTNILLFNSRKAIAGSQDNILQETIIIRAINSSNPIKQIEIIQSDKNINKSNLKSYKVNYDVCIKKDENCFLLLPTCKKDINILSFVNNWVENLGKLGFRIKTGIVVDFRETKWIRKKASNRTIPLLWSYNFYNNKIIFPIKVESKPQYLINSPDTKRLQMNVANYILLKRFTSKEESRRIQCSLLFKEDFEKYDGISTENHLNFITKVNGELTKEELYGLFVLLNSTYLDKYFRILSGSTQVNANEINAIPFPSLEDILQLGKKAMMTAEISEFYCDKLIEEHFVSLQMHEAM